MVPNLSHTHTDVHYVGVCECSVSAGWFKLKEENQLIYINSWIMYLLTGTGVSG